MKKLVVSEFRIRNWLWSCYEQEEEKEGFIFFRFIECLGNIHVLRNHKKGFSENGNF